MVKERGREEGRDGRRESGMRGKGEDNIHKKTKVKWNFKKHKNQYVPYEIEDDYAHSFLVVGRKAINR